MKHREEKVVILMYCNDDIWCRALSEIQSRLESKMDYSSMCHLNVELGEQAPESELNVELSGILR